MAPFDPTITVSNEIMTDSIIAAVNGVHHSCAVNTDMFSHYTGGALPTTSINGKPVIYTFMAIHGAQTKILTDSEMTPVLTAPNFARAAQIVLETLQFSVPATGEAMAKKKSQLKAAGLVDAAINSLEILLANHQAAGVAIGPKVDHSNKTLALALEKEVTDVTASLIDSVNFLKAC